MPVARWFSGPLQKQLEQSLSVLKDTGLFQASELDRLLAEHLAKRHDHRKKLWTLYSLGSWFSAQKPLIPRI
jgi:hypothetical protein